MDGINELIQISKALSDETRVAILREIACKGTVTCKSILDNYGLSQPTLSHHFAVLERAGLINIEKSGKFRLLTLNRKRIKDYKILLGSIEAAK